MGFPAPAAGLVAWQAGSRPGGRGTFLCFAKAKYPKEKRAGFVDPPLRYGHAALLGPGGVRANSLRSNMRAPDPPGPPLLASSLRRREANAEAHKDAPWRVLVNHQNIHHFSTNWAAKNAVGVKMISRDTIQ